MPKFFMDFVIPYYAVKCEEKMLERHLDEMNKFFCQGVSDCVYDIKLDKCEANPAAGPTVRPAYHPLNQCFPTFFDLLPKIAPGIWVVTNHARTTIFFHRNAHLFL